MSDFPNRAKFSIANSSRHIQLGLKHRKAFWLYLCPTQPRSSVKARASEIFVGL